MKHRTTQTSSIRRRYLDWYKKPVEVTVRFKKPKRSTFIILILLAYILWPHVAHGQTIPHETGLNLKPATSQLNILKPYKPSKAVKEIEPVYIAPEPPAPTGGVVAGCGDNKYASFVYMHESGCDTYDPNPTSGACGIGQAWPCEKMPCGHTPADYACQNEYFTSYANSKYGGWAGAYAFWLAHSWW